MTSFLDGPAAGQGLNLRRSPLFLRVVHDTVQDTWDALDLLDDKPTALEEVYVYVLAAPPQEAFVCGRGDAPSGRFSYGIYRLYHEQPLHVRTTTAWRRWVLGRPEAAYAGAPEVPGGD